MTSRDERTCYLSTYDLHRLNQAAVEKLDRQFRAAAARGVASLILV